MPRDTTAQMGEVQAVPAYKHTCVRVCACHSAPPPPSGFEHPPQQQQRASRPLFPLGGGTPSMQLLFHVCVAARHWPTAIHRRHQATRPWPLTRFHGRFLPSMNCVWHIGCIGSLHTALWSAPLSAASQPNSSTALQSAVVRAQPLPTSTTSTTTAAGAEAALPLVGGACRCCCVVLCYRSSRC